MDPQIIYYQDAAGKVYRREVSMMDDTIMSYPTDAFDVVDGNLVPKAGYIVLTEAEGEALLAAEAAALSALDESYVDEQITDEQDRVTLIQAAFTGGEFGTMTPATIQVLFGVDVS